MNIDGLSEATLEKFIAKGFIHNFGDIFEIETIQRRDRYDGRFWREIF